VCLFRKRLCGIGWIRFSSEETSKEAKIMKTSKITDRHREETDHLLLGGIVLFLLGCVLSAFLRQEPLTGLFLCNFGMWMMIGVYKSRKVTKMPLWSLKIAVWGNLAISGGLIVFVIVKIFGG